MGGDKLPRTGTNTQEYVALEKNRKANNSAKHLIATHRVANHKLKEDMSNFNTSHVSINRYTLGFAITVVQFQYIPCFY